jgi:tetratricopeptide (TPR) repeat protein
LLEAEVCQWMTRPTEQHAAATTAMNAFARGSSGWIRALGLACWSNLITGNVDEIVALATSVRDTPLAGDVPHHRIANLCEILIRVGQRELADELMRIPAIGGDDPFALAFLRSAEAKRLLLDGDTAGSLAMERESAELFDRVGDVRRALVRWTNVACTYNQLGRYAEARDMIRPMIERGMRVGSTQSVMWARQNLSLALAYLGELDEAADLIGSTIAHAREHGIRDLEGGSACYAAIIARLRGRLDDAERHARSALEILTSVSPLLEAHARSVLAEVLVTGGRFGEALDVAMPAMEVVSSGGGLEEGESQLRLAYAEALYGLGRIGEARAAIEAAHARVLARADQLTDPVSRRSFLDAIENRETLARYEAWRDGSS